MRKPSKTRWAILQELEMAGRNLSAITVMFHAAVSRKAGLSSVEEKTIDVLARSGPLTARELTRRIGLAPASVTALISRLVKKRFIERVANPEDGRSILVQVRADGLARLTTHFENFARALDDLYATYTDEELDVILRFMTEAALRQRNAADQLVAPRDSARGSTPNSNLPTRKSSR